MTLRTWAIATAIVGFSLASSVSATQPQSTSERHKASVQELLKRVDGQKKDDLKGISEALTAVVFHPDFSTLEPGHQLHIYTYQATLLSHLGDQEKAYEAMVRAQAIPNLELYAKYWELLDQINIRRGKAAEAVEGFTRRVADSPEQIKTYTVAYVYQMARVSRSLGKPEAERQLLEALKAANYDPDNGATAESLWFQLLQNYLNAGDTQKASDIAKDFKSSYPVIQFRINKLYQPLRSVSAQDIENALETDLDGYRQAIKEHPQKLEPTFRLASELGEHGRPAAGLAVLDTALGIIDAAPKGQPTYDDLRRFHNWSYDSRSRFLRQLGRYDEAEAAMVRAQKLAIEYNTDKVSHTINLGWLYNSFSRPKDALKVVENVETQGASLFGKMSAEEVRACAYAQLGEAEKLKASIALMLENAAVAYRPLETALLCANDSESLAKLIISRLGDLSTRDTALLDVQTYLMPMGATAQETLLETRRREVLAREDVQAAVRNMVRLYLCQLTGAVTNPLRRCGGCYPMG